MHEVRYVTQKGQSKVNVGWSYGDMFFLATNTGGVDELDVKKRREGTLL